MKKMKDVELTRRELDVVQMAWDGLTVKGTANALGLSPHWVKNVRYRISKKMGTTNMMLIVRAAVHRRWIACERIDDRFESEIELGDVAQDLITGFRGVVVCVSHWLHGFRRITIQPQDLQPDGKVKDAISFDEPQLKLISKSTVSSTADTGGPRPEPVRKVAR